MRIADFLLGLLFNPDDGSKTFQLNVGGLLPNYHGVTTQKIVLFKLKYRLPNI
jgi:hypothetical protein